MRIRIVHHLTYTYETPARAVLQILRLTPRDHDGQHVTRWRIDVDLDARLRLGRDTYGNVTQTLSVDGPVSKMRVSIDGEVETTDINGIVRGGAERFAPEIFLRDTALTLAGDAIRALANDAGGNDQLDIAHRLLGVVHDTLTLKHETVEATGEAALKRGTGSAHDFAHILVSAARYRGLPARIVSGYCYPEEDAEEPGPSQRDLHVWCEIHIAGLGWIAFDPSMALCATDAYVRVAVGLDHLDAAPVRAANYGGYGETREIALNVETGRRQSQGQSQS